VTNESSDLPTLEEVLRKINESVDDFASVPARTASDKGAFDDYPIHKVAIWGDLAAAQVLLNNGANPNSAGEDGDTPLHRAISGGHSSMVQLLIANGADPEIENRYGSTPRNDAERLGNEQIVAAIKVPKH
jgi:ankyrin repeat protein